MFIAAKLQKPQTLYSSKQILLVKLLQVHFIVSLMGIQRRVRQKQNRNTATYRHNPHCSTVASKIMRYIAFFWSLGFLCWFFVVVFFVWCGLIFLASLHSECNEAQLFIEINGFHRDEDSAIYIKERTPDQALWAHNKHIGSCITDFGG